MMSDEQLRALLAKVNEDAALREKIKTAADLDVALAIAEEAGFYVSKAEWLNYQAKNQRELSNEELEAISGGGNPIANWNDTWECGTDGSTAKECWCGH
jgi:predicted ribosomally synthesized peptide with nif11-like leader